MPAIPNIQLLTPVFRTMLSEDIKASLRTRFLRGSFWSLAGQGFTQVLSLAASVVTARLLGKEGFGGLGVILSTVGMYGTFAGVNLGLTAVKFVAEWRVKQPERAGQIINLSLAVAMICSCAVCLILFFTAPVVSARLLNAPGLAGELRIGCILLFANALQGVQTGALSGFEAFQSIARATLIRGIASLPITVAATYFWGLTGAVMAYAAASVIGLAANQVYLVSACRASGVPLGFRPGAMREWKILWDYSLPAFLCGAVMSPVSWLVNAMLVNQPNGYGEMGVFSASLQWRNAFLFVPGVIGNVVVSLVSSLQGESDRRRVRQVLAATVALTGGVSLLLLGGLTVFSGPILKMYGRGFAGHESVLILTGITATLMAIQTPVGHMISGLGKMWMAALMNGGLTVVLVAGAWVLLRLTPGALGLAQAYLVAYSAHSLWTFWFAKTVLSSDKVFARAAVTVA